MIPLVYLKESVDDCSESPQIAWHVALHHDAANQIWVSTPFEINRKVVNAITHDNVVLALRSPQLERTLK
jgi:hypothetical protein